MLVALQSFPDRTPVYVSAEHIVAIVRLPAMPADNFGSAIQARTRVDYDSLHGSASGLNHILVVEDTREVYLRVQRGLKSEPVPETLPFLVSDPKD